MTLSDEEICSTFNDFFANTVINLSIPVIKHSHHNLQTADPILATIYMRNTEVLEEWKIIHAIPRSVSDKPILTKLVKSLIIRVS